MLLRKFFTVFLYIYLQIANISCEEGGSLAFAIDDTASMGDDIKYVREGAEAIMNLVLSKKSNIKEVILVTFNDPDVELRTKNSSQNTFVNDLKFISPHGGGYCPEMALSGIEEALKASKPGSYIYVFTDANAEDYSKLNKVKSLCQKKQSQVVIVYSKDRYCYDPTGVEFMVYHDIAKACSGQIFIVNKDQINSLLKTIETLLQGKHSIFKWITVPRTQPDQYVYVEFTLDEKAEYAIVSTSGTNVDVRITREKNKHSPQVRLEKVMWNANGKVVKLIDPNPGTYYAWVKGDSSISVVVYGRTDFTFEHGFSILEPKLLTDTAKQPIAGLEQHVSIIVTDPDHAVNIQTVQILDINNNDRVIRNLPLRNIGEDFYITDAFVSPNYTFRITVIGEIKRTHQTITRTSKNIDPRIVDLIPESIPEIKIDEGMTLDVKYGSAVSLTCKVTAHPAPEIKWYTSSGHLRSSEGSVIDDPLFVSYLKLKNIQQNETYICKAFNKKGHGRERRIQVGVRPIFTVIGEVDYYARYGALAIIPCNIESYLPYKIHWFRSGKQLSNSSEHNISRHGSQLMLNSVHIGMQGKYTCEAILNSDPAIKKTNHRNVMITGVARPKISFANAVLKENTLTAICRIEGVPKPVISWKFKAKSSEVFSTLSETGEELKIRGMRLKDTGIYKCVAKNVLGEIENDFNVVVEERPIIHNEVPTNYYGVEGDLVMMIPCIVTGFPEPTIVWKKEGKALKMNSKYKIQEATLHINQPVQSDSAEYTCEAKNKLGTATKTVVVEIVDNFEGDGNFKGDTHGVNAEQGISKTIKCNLKNVGERSVRWYMDGVLTNQTGSTYTIERPSILDESNYTCRVNTDEGSKSETFIVYVGYSPVFEDNSDLLQTIDWKFINEMLVCTADALPPARYDWVFNGKVIEAGYDKKQLNITSWGEYKCQASNVHGTISRTFQVITTGCFITKHIATQNPPLPSDKDAPTWLLSSMSNSDIILKENTEIKFSCPNTKTTTNVFKVMPKKKEVIAKCNTQDQFTVDGKTYRYTDLQCNKKVEPSVINTGEQCSGPNSEKIRVGFEVNGFLDAYKVCYDKNLNVPLYASPSHYITGSGDAVDSMKFTWSPTPELSNRKTGNWKSDGSCKCCYTQGQLVNAKEMPFGPAQVATFKNNLNSIPIWNPSCDDTERTSWQTFENEVREMSYLHEKWSSWTGASEYVTKDGGLVPRYLWKVIENDDGSTVTVYVNDKSPVDSDVRCASRCDSMMEADKFLYCCTLDDFSKSFGVPLTALKAI